jgi:hypothetical protein
VNEYRCHKHYSDRLAAVEKRGTSMKQSLEGSPFLSEFDYGVTVQWYWTYNHMVLQLEDCVDVVAVFYGNYDYVFLFDHSCGHDRK